eukprot:m.55759 g.55759  ORF g.55759 m.55759 type:complete len:1519 (-) comp7627_c0_seq2:71-4627(-)
MMNDSAKMSSIRTVIILGIGIACLLHQTDAQTTTVAPTPLTSAPTSAPTLLTSAPTLPTSAPTPLTSAAPTPLTTAPTLPTSAPTPLTSVPTLATSAPTPSTGAPTSLTNPPTPLTTAPTLATGTPTDAPTTVPSTPPTAQPSVSPSANPTLLPTSVPTVVTLGPTSQPTTSRAIWLWLRVDGLTQCSSMDAAIANIEAGLRLLNVAGLIDVVGGSSIASCALAPTAVPTTTPTVNPTAVPTDIPTEAPTEAPTEVPTAVPSNAPTAAPRTASPTALPTHSPTREPTDSPQQSTSASPTVPTLSPTEGPTALPSVSPSVGPTNVPTLSPTVAPTHLPTLNPTAIPTVSPTTSPTHLPTPSPTNAPTVSPSASPTHVPTASPTDAPSTSPTGAPVTTTAPTSAGRRLRARRQTCNAGFFADNGSCVRCFAFQFSTSGATSCSVPQQCTPGQYVSVAPSITNDRQCATASGAQAVVILEVIVDAVRMDVVAQALETAATDSSLDGTVGGVSYTTALPVPTPTDTPLSGFSYDVVTVNITSVSQNRNLLSNATRFFQDLYDAVPNATPQAVEPFGTLIISITQEALTFRVASAIDTTTNAGSALPALQAWLTSNAFGDALFNDNAPAVDLDFALSAVQTPLPTSQSPTNAPVSLAPSAAPTETPSTSPVPAPTLQPTGAPTPLDATQGGASSSGGGDDSAVAVYVSVIVVVLFLVVAAGLTMRQKRNRRWPFENNKAQPSLGSYVTSAEEIKYLQPAVGFKIVSSESSHGGAPMVASYLAPEEPVGSDQYIDMPSVPDLGPVQSHVVRVVDLAKTIQHMSANSDYAFSEEYECLETGCEFSRQAASLDDNKIKNRYANILPYDHTRVRLPVLPGDPYSDYINANYISSRSEHSKYIAAQGPTQLTVIDFWRMLWETKAPVVIMITNCEEKGRIKCHRYWPIGVGEPLDLLDDFSVTWTHTEEYPDFVIRTLEMEYGGKTFSTRQFHYTSWPDHGVPESTAATLMMLRKARAARTGHVGPMVVHCSAGVGRTGTLLGIDINIDRMSDTDAIDVYGTLNQMRRERNTMVQTEEQYIFIYRALADASTNMNTEMSKEQLKAHCQRLHSINPKTGQTFLETEFKQVDAMQASMNYRTDAAQLPQNESKNRFHNVIPFESTRVKLLPVPGVTGSDYINANYIDGYTSRRAYIATQSPLENTIQDFWRMAWEREVDIIVMLTELVEGGQVMCDQYWPDADDGAMVAGDFDVVLDEEHATVWGYERRMTLINRVSDTSRQVKHFQYIKWPEADENPDAEIVCALLMAIKVHQDSKIVLEEENIYGNAAAITAHAIASQTKPIIVHDAAGVGRTGAFCALHTSMKKLDLEGKIDLFTVVKHMRTQRMSMVETSRHYEWVYSILNDTIHSNEPDMLLEPDHDGDGGSISSSQRSSGYLKFTALTPSRPSPGRRGETPSPASIASDFDESSPTVETYAMPAYGSDPVTMASSEWLDDDNMNHDDVAVAVAETSFQVGYTSENGVVRKIYNI